MNLEVSDGHKVEDIEGEEPNSKEKYEPPVSKDIMWIRRNLQSGSRIRMLCR